MIKVIYAGDFGLRWNGLYVTLEDFEDLLDIQDVEERQQELFKLFDCGFTLDESKHRIVDI